MLQPLAIAYTRRNGLPVTRRDRPFSPGTATWSSRRISPGSSASGAIDVEVTWGEPIAVQTADRKEATALAEAAVRAADPARLSRAAAEGARSPVAPDAPEPLRWNRADRALATPRRTA